MSSIRGVGYPLRVENGNLQVKVDFALKTQEIRSVVETRFFERVMRADYGVGDYTLSIIDPGAINSEFQAAIVDNVKGLSSLVVTGDWISQGEEGVYKVIITYSIENELQPPLNFFLSK